MKYTTDKSGKVINSEVINPGSRGDDLQLTIDIDLQKKVESLLKIKSRRYAVKVLKIWITRLL